LESTLAYIQAQLWAVIGLLVIFIVTNILCNIAKGRNPYRPNFKSMWETNRLDELLSSSAAYRRKYPNSSDAHYFAIKALLATGRLAEARELATRLQTIEPTLAKATEEWLDLISSKQGG
jgi:hypothetical protein